MVPAGLFETAGRGGYIFRGAYALHYHFSNPEKILVQGAGNLIWTTDNFGANWRRLSSPGESGQRPPACCTEQHRVEEAPVSPALMTLPRQHSLPMPFLALAGLLASAAALIPSPPAVSARLLAWLWTSLPAVPCLKPPCLS